MSLTHGLIVWAIAEIDHFKPHQFRHTIGSVVTHTKVVPMLGKELMGLKCDRIFQRYMKGVFRQARMLI